MGLKDEMNRIKDATNMRIEYSSRADYVFNVKNRYIAFSKAAQTLLVGNTNFDDVIINFSDVQAYEIYIDVNEKKSKGAMGAAVGGVLLGPVGAISGGLLKRGTDKTKVKKTGVYITTEKFGKFFFETTQSKNAIQDTETIGNLLDSIVTDNNSKTVANNIEQPTIPVSSDADEIKKFAELRNEGIITEDEFQAKKKQLLGL